VPLPAKPAAEAEVGQPSEAAARARRLYESERYRDAIPALQAVIAGQTGDDEGNRQLSQFFLAKALFRTRSYARAAAAFRAIARAPAHLKHAETLLWLARLAAMPETAAMTEPSDLATYSVDDVRRFDNPEQRTVYWQLSYLLGVERLRAGQRAEAASLFAAVPGESPLHAAAVRCAGYTRPR
jgi:hypothetical protein